ncbi:MAG: ammonium transporter [Candidatus Sumerlaeia bacterium]|nr:ammonium transporter [Candidatus Sumerlaeia bacterium]
MLAVFFLFSVPAARAADAAAINSGDTSFLLVSAALVMLMTPGLALFYGGMVRRKNVLATIMHSFTAVAIISVQWVLWGYSLAFGPDIGGVIGSLAWVGLREVGTAPYPAYSATVPHQLFMIYQCMFAIITPALISGAMAERMNFKAYVLFLLLWATFVYDPVAHWVWGDGGWLKKLGALDFAGGTVVHLISGVTALAAALMLGRRTGWPREAIMPHNLPFTVMGAGILWFGWFGFNAGSALAAGELSATAFVATNTAAAAAALTWMLLDWASFGKPTALGTASGAVAGLVAITPAAGFVTPLAAIVIGCAGGAACRQVVVWRTRRGIDDSLDAFGVHGIGGMTGALLTGVLATVGASGLIAGNVRQLVVQVIGVVVTAAYALGVSFIILKALDASIGLRVSEREEMEGLDLSQHGEAAYTD